MCLLQQYDMNCKHRAFIVNDAHLATKEELREKYTTVNLCRDGDLAVGGLPVLSDGLTATVNTEDEMTIIYGATGTKKTRVLISPLVSVLALAGESMIIPDVKGELTSGVLSAKIMGILNERGYNIRVLNFRTLNQDGFDLLGETYREYREGDREEAMVELHKLVDQLASIYKGSCTEPIWTRSAKEYLMAIAVLLFELCEDPKKVNLLSLASFTTRTSCTEMEKIAEMIGHKNNVMTMLRSVLSEPERTRMSTMATVSSFFSDLIINEKMMRMLGRSTFRLDELYEKKTVLFVVMPDEVDTYGAVVGIILSRISAFLVKKAYEFGGQLPRRVNYICDEFCNYYIPGMEKNISAHRSRKIRWYLSCQSRNQLKMAYPRECGTILSNCTNLYFMGSPDTDLLEELSERAGYAHIAEKPCCQRQLIGVDKLRRLKKGWEYSEVYFTSGIQTCITVLPDIDQYVFLQDFTKSPARASNIFRKLSIYDSEQMLKDVYEMRMAKRAKDEGRRMLTSRECEMADKYEEMFQERKTRDTIIS